MKQSSRLRRIATEGASPGPDLGLLFEQAPDAMVLVHSGTGAIVDVNPATERMLGIDRETLRGRHYLTLHPRDQAEAVRKVFDQRIRRRGGPDTLELLRKDRIRMPVDVNAAPITHGRQRFVLGVFRDISRRRQMEKALQDSEERYRSVLLNAPIVSFVIDERGIFTLSEGKGLAKLGLKPGQVVGLSSFTVYRGYPQVIRLLKTALRGESVRGEVSVHDGEYDVRCTPVRNSRGRVVKVIGLAIDITENKRAREAQAEEHDLYMDLVNSLPAGVYRLRIRRQQRWGEKEWVGKVESNYELELVSDLFCRYLGASREQFTANAATVVDCLHPDDRADFVRRNVVALKNLRVFEWEGRVRHPGPTQWVRFVSVPRRMPNGDVIWTGVLVDITEARQIRQALQKSHDDLEDRVRERTARLRALASQVTQVEHKERRRIAEILHEDLQQRLAGMMFIIQGIADDKKGYLDDDAAAQLLKQLGEAIQTMRDLTTRFRPPALYEFGLVPALEWLAGQMRERFALSIDIVGDRDLKVEDHDMRLFAYQAVSELFMNVVKHAGAPQATLRLRRRDKTGMAIEVSDKGRGFDRATAHRAASFGLFSIAERVADFGGRFDIASQPGRGTRATIWLPRAAGTDA